MCVCHVRVSDPLELELKKVVAAMWVLGFETGSFRRVGMLLTTAPFHQPYLYFPKASFVNVSFFLIHNSLTSLVNLFQKISFFVVHESF